MILVTGATGFIGQALIKQLLSQYHEVRLLIRPSRKTPSLPVGIPVEVAVANLKDERGLRSALNGIDIIYHLAGSERKGAYASLLEDDIQGTQMITTIAKEAGVKRIIYLSHLGADRASAYPLLKAKAIAEEIVRRSGIEYTIIRSAVAYGPGDHFTLQFARLAYLLPFVFPIPGDGQMKLQPIWINDLALCLAWCLDIPATINQTHEIGGGEYLSYETIMQKVLSAANIKRTFIHIYPSYLRLMVIFLENSIPYFPISIFWLDYLAANRTCALDTLPRVFNLIPSLFDQHLAYLNQFSILPLPSFLRKPKAKKKPR